VLLVGSLIKFGSAFQAIGPATENARRLRNHAVRSVLRRRCGISLPSPWQLVVDAYCVLIQEKRKKEREEEEKRLAGERAAEEERRKAAEVQQSAQQSYDTIRDAIYRAESQHDSA